MTLPLPQLDPLRLKHLADCDGRYDAQTRLLGIRFTSPGYHTRLETDAWVHPTVPSLEYAVLLMRRADPASLRRAEGIVRSVLPLQATDPTGPWYGVWPYALEEPIPAMENPDVNWADFCAGRLLEFLLENRDRLDASLAREVAAAIGHAAWGIFRRNIQPGYTNIAIMGAGVTAAAGEALGDAKLLDYGRLRLANILRHVDYHGTFVEYNSPPYTMVALQECERMLHLVSDPEIRVGAERLRRVAWQVIADHWHVGTHQWAGPHARAYADRIDDITAGELSLRLDLPIPVPPGCAPGVWTGPLNMTAVPIPCPAEMRCAFQEARAQERRQLLIRRTAGAASVYGTTWMIEEACLGSASEDSLRPQARAVLGYWRGSGHVVGVLRVRMLKNGRDITSGRISSVQKGPRLLAAFGFYADLGDWHWLLDRPANNTFEIADLRVRFEITAPGAQGSRLRPGVFRLSDGYRSTFIHTLPGRFADAPVAWELGSGEGCAYVDAICYQGARRPFQLTASPPLILAAGLEFLGGSQTDASQGPSLQTRGDELEAVWDIEPGLRLSHRLQAYPYVAN